MSAELLRRAAAKMRERAEDIYPYHQGTWRTEPGPAGWSEIRCSGHIADDGFGSIDVDHDTYVCQMDTTATAEHIASWHPGVAVAVADLLEHLAIDHENADIDGRTFDSVVAVARAYLNEGA